MHEKLGKETPCLGCKTGPPELDPRNELANDIYNVVFSCRNASGGLEWPVLLALSEKLELSATQLADVIYKVAHVEAGVSEKQAAAAEQKAKQAAQLAEQRAATAGRGGRGRRR